jgi:hypothetical protein
MKKLLTIVALSIFLTACMHMPQEDYIRPSDVLLDKATLIGNTGNVVGALSCTGGNYCQLYEKGGKLGLESGSYVAVVTDNLSREDRKFILT